MKRLLAAAAALLLCLNLVPTAHGVSTSAGSAILMEAESGRVLYEQDAGRPRLIASVTKLMTALVALESGCPLEEKVVIREEDTRTEGAPGRSCGWRRCCTGCCSSRATTPPWRWPGTAAGLWRILSRR